MMNPTSPMVISGLRPNRSPSLPAIGITSVEVTRKAVVTQAYRSSPLRSARICGIAVPTMVPSSDTTRMAMPVPMVAASRGGLGGGVHLGRRHRPHLGRRGVPAQPGGGSGAGPEVVDHAEAEVPQLD